MKVCWFGNYKKDYSRNNILLSGLYDQGVEIVECNTRERGFKKYMSLIQQLRALDNDYDVLYCAFPSQHVLPVAKIFQSKPILSDAFFPIYDANVCDRKVVSKYSVKAVWYWLLDYLLIRLSDVVVVDTNVHKEYWQKYYSKTSIEVVPLGVESDKYFPLKNHTKSVPNKTVVTFHGSYIPLQGIDKILGAVELLKGDASFHFRFIGQGQLYSEVLQKAQRNKLEIEFLPWQTESKLNEFLNDSDIILGIFGDTDKTDRVVPNKVMQGIAVGRPVITKDTSAIREQFSENELCLVKNDSESIKDAIVQLAQDSDKRSELVERANIKYFSDYSTEKLGLQLHQLIDAARNRS